MHPTDRRGVRVQWVQWAGQNPTVLPFVAISTGTSEEDIRRASAVQPPPSPPCPSLPD
jgi:hypothetical protein